MIACSWSWEVTPASGCRAAERLALPKTVTRMARPSELPPCWPTLTRLEAAPESFGVTPDRAIRGQGQGRHPDADAVAEYAASKRGLEAMLTKLDGEVLSYCRDTLRSAGSALLERAHRAVVMDGLRRRPRTVSP